MRYFLPLRPPYVNELHAQPGRSPVSAVRAAYPNAGAKREGNVSQVYPMCPCLGPGCIHAACPCESLWSGCDAVCLQQVAVDIDSNSRLRKQAGGFIEF